LLETIVDIIAVSTSPNGSILEISQETFSLNCSIDLILPWGTLAPSLVWFFDSTNSSPELPDGVTMSNTSKIDNNTYSRTLHFSPLLESHMGTYVCQIEGNNRQSTNTSIMISTTAKTIIYLVVCILTGFVLVSIQISDGGIPLVIGQSYNLICDVSTNVSRYRWKRNGEVMPGEENKFLEFQSLQLSNVGNYTCEVAIGLRSYTAENHKSIILESK
jgi:hypothetical protein